MSKKRKKIEIEKYLPGLFARTESYASNVSKYYTDATNALLDLAADVDLAPNTVFYFADNKKLSVKATNVLRGLYSAVYQEIRRGVIAEWEFANLSNDAMVESIFGKGLKDNNHYARWFSRNQDAMDAFFKRKSEYGGLNLSQKVWKYTGQFKEEIELALSASLGRGDSAATVSRHVRQYLQEPDKLFRRVRDEEGNLKLSKRAAAYHPGRGEYRSSYKNAMRLARTETNMAYRAADSERWAQLDFVVGIEVKRSNHKFPCKLCEKLAGEYPKDFDFRGWHPQCRCQAIPILCAPSEFVAMQKRILNDEGPGDSHSVNEVTEPHGGFKKWLSENRQRIDEAAKRGTLPYWMKDNPKYLPNTQKMVKDIRGKVEKLLSARERKVYVTFEPFSPLVLEKLSKRRDLKHKLGLFEEILNDERAKELSRVENARTVVFPGHKGNQHSTWKDIQKMAEDLNRNGESVVFLPELDKATSADALVLFRGRPVVADFKYCITKKANTLAGDLEKGFLQAGTVVVKLENMDAGVFKDAVDYLVRNNIHYGNIKVINKYGKFVEITAKDIRFNNYGKKIKGFL